MAPLRWPEHANRLDFDLLRESPVTLYRSREVLAAREMQAKLEAARLSSMP